MNPRSSDKHKKWENCMDISVIKLSLIFLRHTDGVHQDRIFDWKVLYLRFWTTCFKKTFCVHFFSIKTLRNLTNFVTKRKDLLGIKEWIVFLTSYIIVRRYILKWWNETQLRLLLIYLIDTQRSSCFFWIDERLQHAIIYRLFTKSSTATTSSWIRRLCGIEW